MAVKCRLEDVVNFEPASIVTNVFFDDKNQQVFSVRSGGATGILVRGFGDESNSTFRLEEQGPIISIKLSPDQNVLAVQRGKTTVQFLSVLKSGKNGELDRSKAYSQTTKRSVVLGLHWLSTSEIMFLTNLGIELYGVIDEKKVVKSIRQQSQSIQWYCFCSTSGVLVTSAARTTSHLQPFAIKANGNVVKLPKVDHTLAAASSSHAVEILEREVNVFTLYQNQVFISIICREPDQVTLHLYSVSRDELTVTRTHVLYTPYRGGGVAINVVDDLIIVHHQNSGTSAVFDVAATGESDGHLTHHRPIGSVVEVVADEEREAKLCYSDSWLTFAPDVIIDAKIGRMWRLKVHLDLEKMTRKNSKKDLPHTVSFLLQRDRAKTALLDVLLDWCSSTDTELHAIGTSFNLINREYRAHLDSQIQSNLALPSHPFFSPPSSSLRNSLSCVDFSRSSADEQPDGGGKRPPRAKVILDQSDFHSNLFNPMLESACDVGRVEEQRRRMKRLVSILLEYSRSLEERHISVQHFLSELLIHLLVRNRSWYQLHQLLQYHVITDTKPLACLLLSLESIYPPAGQLALDMLARLRNSVEEICEILLSKKRILSAIQFADQKGLMDCEGVRAGKFLEAAIPPDGGDDDAKLSELERTKKRSECNAVFVSAYNFFRDKNMLQRDCDEYTELYEKVTCASPA